MADELELGEEFVLQAIWGKSAVELVAVGTKSTVIEYNGIEWKIAHQDLSLDTLNGVWGASMNDIWAVGAYGAILHRNSEGWTVIEEGCKSDPDCKGFPTLWDVWGTSSSNVYAVGNTGTILHWDGKAWKKQSGGVANDLFGISGNADVLVAVGDQGEAVHDLSGVLISDETGTSARLTAVAVLPNNEAIGVGDAGTIVRHNGTGWMTQSSGTFAGLKGVWSNGQTSFAVGENGTILTSMGSGPWLAMQSGQTETLYALDGSDPSSMFAVGSEGLLMDYNGTSWTKVGNLGNDFLYDIHHVGVGVYFVAGSGGTVISNHTTGVWEKITTPTTADLNGIWGASQSNVWAVGNLGVIIHWNGVKWNAVASPTEMSLKGIWGRAEDDIYAVGEAGALVHWDGTEWTTVRSNTLANLRSVWGLNENDIYAVGQGATIMHYNGIHWSQIKVEDEVSGGQAQPVVDELYGVWGANATDIWAVGRDGAMIHLTVDPETEETAWIKVPFENEVTLRGIWGYDDKHMWLAGREGYIFSFNGNALIPQQSGSIATLYDIFGIDEDSILAVGDLGTVLRYSP